MCRSLTYRLLENYYRTTDRSGQTKQATDQTTNKQTDIKVHWDVTQPTKEEMEYRNGYNVLKRYILGSFSGTDH